MTVDTMWGSCQYTSIADTYVELCKLEETLSRDEIIKKLGIKIGPVYTLSEILSPLKKLLLVDLKAYEDDDADVICSRVQLEEINSVTEIFHYLRDRSWDLWSAAPYVAASIFPELNLDSVPDRACLMQSANQRIGIICWLLKSYGFVEDEEPFTEFDT